MHVTEEEQSQINRLVAEAEAKSGVQVLMVIVARAEAYPENPVESVRNRCGVCQPAGLLVLIARFERQAAIVADIGVRRYIREEQLAAVAALIKPLLAPASMTPACTSCLSALTVLLPDRLTARGTPAQAASRRTAAIRLSSASPETVS